MHQLWPNFQIADVRIRIHRSSPDDVQWEADGAVEVNLEIEYSGHTAATSFVTKVWTWPAALPVFARALDVLCLKEESHMLCINCDLIFRSQMWEFGSTDHLPNPHSKWTCYCSCRHTSWHSLWGYGWARCVYHSPASSLPSKMKWRFPDALQRPLVPWQTLQMGVRSIPEKRSPVAFFQGMLNWQKSKRQSLCWRAKVCSGRVSQHRELQGFSKHQGTPWCWRMEINATVTLSKSFPNSTFCWSVKESPWRPQRNSPSSLRGSGPPSNFLALDQLWQGIPNQTRTTWCFRAKRKMNFCTCACNTSQLLP